MANLREAYDYAKNNPNSDFAKQLEKALGSGALDDEAQKYDIDTTVFKPAVAPTPKIEEDSFGTQIGKAVLDPLTKIGASTAKALLPSALESEQLKSGQYPSVFSGNVDLVGFKDGQRLDAVDTAKDVAGTAMTGASYLPIGGAVVATGKGILSRQLPKFFSLAKQGAAGGGLQGGGEALQQGGGAGDFVAGTAGGATVGAVTAPVLGMGAGLAAKPITKTIDTITKPLETFKGDVVKNINKALSIQGKKSIGNAVNVVPEKRYQAFETLYDLSPEITVKDDIGQEVPFNPKETNFQQFGEALYKTKNNLWGKVETELKKATQKGLEVDITPALEDLRTIIETPGTPVDVIKTAIGLNDELMRFTTENGTAPVQALARYNSFLNKKITGQLTGTTNNATREVEAILAKNLSESVDNSIEGLQGAGFAKLKDQYSSLKAIENDTVRRMQQELRMLDTGLADFMGQYGTADMIGGLVQAAQGNPTNLVRGIGTKVAANYMKSLREPSKYLRDAFTQIEKYKGGKGITPALEEIKAKTSQSFSKAAVPQTVSRETKGDSFWREYLKNKEIDSKINARAGVIDKKIGGSVNEYGQRVVSPWGKETLTPMSEADVLSEVDKKSLVKFLNNQPDATREAYLQTLSDDLSREQEILYYMEDSIGEKVGQLRKYEGKRGEFKGTLNINNGKGKFGKNYDSMLQETMSPGETNVYSDDLLDKYEQGKKALLAQRNVVKQIKDEFKKSTRK